MPANRYELLASQTSLTRMTFFSSRNNMSMFNFVYIERQEEMHDLTGFQRDLLYVIAGRDEPKGLEIKEELEEYYQSEVHHGRLYPNLDTLVDNGLIEKGTKDNRTNAYTLTQQGHRMIQARKEWEDRYLQHAEVETEV